MSYEYKPIATPLDGSDELAHWGIKGQKWGRRRWQNEDGSLTPEGYEHYYGHEKRKPSSKMITNFINDFKSDDLSTKRDAYLKSHLELMTSWANNEKNKHTKEMLDEAIHNIDEELNRRRREQEAASSLDRLKREYPDANRQRAVLTIIANEYEEHGGLRRLTDDQLNSTLQKAKQMVDDNNDESLKEPLDRLYHITEAEWNRRQREKQ